MFHYFLSRENNERLFDNLKKITYNRPRDFLTYIKMEIEKIKGSEKIVNQFTELDVDFISDDFSDYIVGEMKNYASFYIEQKDFDKYIKFLILLMEEIHSHTRITLDIIISLKMHRRNLMISTIST